MPWKDESASFGKDKSALFGKDESASYGEHESASYGDYESASYGKDESASYGKDESASDGKDESASYGKDESALFACRKDSFKLTASYSDDAQLPEGIDRHIASWEIGPIPSRKSGEASKIKVRISLNLHGLVTVDSATIVEEEEYEETIKKPAPKVTFFP